MPLFRSRSSSRVDTKGLTKDQARELVRLTAIIEAHPQDLKARRGLADLYKEAGRIGHAVAEYQALAGAYAAQGLLFRAIATCKHILALDPAHEETHHTLASLYARQEIGPEQSGGIELPNNMAATLSTDDDTGTSGATPPPVPVSSEGASLEGAAIDDADVLDAVDAVDASDVGAAIVSGTGPPVEAEDGGGASSAGADAGGPAKQGGGFGRANDTIPGATVGDIDDVNGAAGESRDDDGGGGAADADSEGAAEDVVDAGDMAALTVRAEGSVRLRRPKSVPLFSGLEAQAFEILVKELKAWEAEPGALVVSEGEDGDSLFVVARGRVRVEREGRDGPIVVGHVVEGGFFGEIAIVASRPRAATVVAEETTELLEISRRTLDELCTRDPRVREVLDAFCAERLKKSVLLSSPMFEGLSPELLTTVAAGFEQRVVDTEHAVVEQGLPSSGLFVVLSGTVDVTVRMGDVGGATGSLRLKQLAAGDVFGEMSLLSGEPASASVTTSSPSRLLVLPASAFSTLSELPELRARIEALSTSRSAFNARFLPTTDVARAGAV